MAPTKLSVLLVIFHSIQLPLKRDNRCQESAVSHEAQVSEIATKDLEVVLESRPNQFELPPPPQLPILLSFPREMRGAETMTLVREPNCPVCRVHRCTNSGTTIPGGTVTDGDPASVLTAGS